MIGESTNPIANSLDDELLKDMKRLKLKVKEIVYINERKKRYTLKVEYQGKKGILKWNHISEELHLRKLRKEIVFYKQNKGKSYIPDLIYAEDNLILIDHLPSRTLREWLIDYRSAEDLSSDQEVEVTSEFKRIIDDITEFFNVFYIDMDSSLSNDEAITLLRNYFDKLYLSAPMSLSRNKLENTLLRVNRKIHRQKIEKSFERIKSKLINDEIQLNQYIVHADLHLNNILVTEEEPNIKVIDWENNTTSTFLIDLNYLYSFIMFLLEGLPRHQHYVYKSFENYFNEHAPELKEVFFNISDLFLIGISVNRSFGYKLPFNYFIKQLNNFHNRLDKIGLHKR